MYSSVPSPPSVWNPGPAPNLDRPRPGEAPISPTSATTPRSGRLRGLSYLRNYTQNHILSRDSNSSSNNQPRPSISRASSHPSQGQPRRASAAPALPNSVPRQTSPTVQRSTSDVPFAGSNNQENLGSTSGWLPTGGALTAISRPLEPYPTAATPSSALLSGNDTLAVASDLTASMGRTRSATTSGAVDMPPFEGAEPGLGNDAASPLNGANGKEGMNHQLPSIRFSAHQDPRAQRPSLVFTAMSRILPTGKEVIKVGRYSERDTQPPPTVNVPSSAPVGFKSKVVSRRHCEFWCAGGKWFIRDVKSSSGTFLNHIRLSSPGTESRPFPVNDGDIVQLGIDFKGGEEMIFRCVKIRVELNKGWQTGPSSFNVQSHKRLRELNNLGKPSASGTSQDCSICLGPIAPCQSLFVAPCSHTWHYKCIRVIINGPHYPHFICPNCRSVADLEAELDDPYANGEWEEVDASDADAPTQPAQPAESTLSPHISSQVRAQNLTSAATNAAVEAEKNQASRKNGGLHDDISIPETSEDSGVDQIVTAVEEDGRTNSDLSNSNAPQISNATVAPVDIIPRRSIGGPACTTRLEEPETGRDSTRTPSPNRLGTSSSDPATHHEGPMTPRNDAGPFVFDGSAGREAEAGLDAGLAALVAMNLGQATATPPQQTTSQAAS